MGDGFVVDGTNAAAAFRLRAYRGEGMALLAMSWRDGEPPDDMVGFAIEYREPGRDRFWPVGNRLTFEGSPDAADPTARASTRAPIQKFRWVHFPFNANLPGAFTYRVTPVFMNDRDELSFGEDQRVELELARETYPGKLNVSFTRGFVSSPSFVERFLEGRTKAAQTKELKTLLPAKAKDGLTFAPTHPSAEKALPWMGFEARRELLEVLDEAVADPAAQVRVVAYDLNEPELVERLERLGDRLRIIIDDSGEHHHASSAESKAATRLRKSAGRSRVKRQHVGKLQHNKTIVIDSADRHVVLAGSTNMTWRGFFVQNNNAVVVRGGAATAAFGAAFEAYWDDDSVASFGATTAAEWADLGLDGIDAQVTFSPHSSSNAVLAAIGDDIRSVESNLFYSLAFLYQTGGPIRAAVTDVTNDDLAFVFGVSDNDVAGIDVQTPDGNVAPVAPAALGPNTPPFHPEPTGGGGNRLHHKFVVLDFDKPTARVYTGSYNFSAAADEDNGDNLLLIRDRRVAVAYMIEGLRIFDHFQFRSLQAGSEGSGSANKEPLALRRPPRAPGEEAWWKRYYTEPRRIRDRELFAPQA